VGRVRILLLSTYELGHQPLHVASPAGALARAGHDVRAADLSLDGLDEELMWWADAVACSVPMHTAFRLARDVCRELRARRPTLPVCLYGLYAGLDGAHGGSPVADAVIVGEYEPGLLAWADAVAAGGPVTPGGRTRVVDLGRGRFGLPGRHLLPPLERYAHVVIDGQRRPAGYVEASHGCAHRCRHCPVPVVYDGRTRMVAVDAVVADVAQLVASGARHVTFGDPDFLNGPHHARRVVDAVHGAFPTLTFDVTAKVEHVLRHRGVWEPLAAAGCVFVVSAFESASDGVLARLAKGHTVADEKDAVRLLRAGGIEPRPSLLPFTPWTRAEDVFDLLDVVARLDLVGNVDPVHYAIRLLVPPDSLLLASGHLDGLLDGYDDEHLGWTWHAADPRLDELHAHLSALAEQAVAEQWPARHTYDAVRASAVDILGGHARAQAPTVEPGLASPLAPDARPRLTEGWFCCAEPTQAQRDTIFATSARGRT
jgi:radical SAM superfamily enzyme YgiQ (UPF0313 family)